jgi:hypothetical protein
MISQKQLMIPSDLVPVFIDPTVGKALIVKISQAKCFLGRN